MLTCPYPGKSKCRRCPKCQSSPTLALQRRIHPNGRNKGPARAMQPFVAYALLLAACFAARVLSVKVVVLVPGGPRKVKVYRQIKDKRRRPGFSSRPLFCSDDLICSPII